MRGSILGRGKSFFSLLNCPDQASNSMDIEAALLGGGKGGKGPERDADHSPPTDA
jgi:hypothetical protein